MLSPLFQLHQTKSFRYNNAHLIFSGCWGFLFSSIVLFIATLVQLGLDTTNIHSIPYVVTADYLLSFSAFLFLLGSALLVYASYPENSNSDMIYSFVTGTMQTPLEKRMQVGMSETQPMLT